MRKVDVMDNKIKGSNLAFLFPLAIATEIITFDNISMFEKLNITKLGLTKNDFWFHKSLYISYKIILKSKCKFLVTKNMK